jgi:deoxyribodipyrimidine photo-lyase
MRTLVWFRGKDLRVSDHAPLSAAVAGGEVICLFVIDPYFFEPARARELRHRMQFLLESIASLATDLESLGSRLLLSRGRSVDMVPEIARTCRVDRVVAQRWSEPFARVRDERVALALSVPFDLFDGETLAPPFALKSSSGGSFGVFTPFARAFRERTRVRAPERSPRSLPPIPSDVQLPTTRLPTLEELGISGNPLLPKGGERAARARLSAFLRGRAARYAETRDRLDLDTTSRLSVDLKFGTLSPRTVWTAAQRALARRHALAWKTFSNELLWREFAYAVLRADPSLLVRPHRAQFASFPWEDDPAGFQAWCEGRTGYPVVDAAARQLLGEGFVHNRARMIAASFLTKDLRIDFRLGEAHYMRHLADGDWAQNDFGWQWTTGSGFDAAPYFRIFNPVAQGRRFDATGGYVRRWVPELAGLPDEWIHEPAKAPADVLARARVVLGKTYPHPIVDHAEARARCGAIMDDLRLVTSARTK